MTENKSIKFKLDGTDIEAMPGESILQVANRSGIEIPQLCFKQGFRVEGNCRACMVEIDGERVLAASCCRQPEPGMDVKSTSLRARSAQKMVVELLMSDMPKQQLSDSSMPSEFDNWCEKLDINQTRFKARVQPDSDLSNPAIEVNLSRCIQCTRCVRACREEQVNGVIGFASRGHKTKVVFDLDDELAVSSCVSCGECVQACPTGALKNRHENSHCIPHKKVDTACPYCGVGCLLTYNVHKGKITHVDGRDGPSNHSRLCVKGRFGFDYINHPGRLTRPLIRRDGVNKTSQLIPRSELGRSTGFCGKWTNYYSS